jgi:hypothetical protein
MQQKNTKKTGGTGYLVHIECCVNCREHAWCTRHQEEKYLHFCTERMHSIPPIHIITISINLVHKAIEAYCADLGVRVSVNSNCTPRMGALEVSVDKAVIFSKLHTGFWPNFRRVAAKVHNYLNAVQNNKDTSEFVVKGAEPNDKFIATVPSNKRALSPSPVYRTKQSEKPKEDVAKSSPWIDADRLKRAREEEEAKKASKVTKSQDLRDTTPAQPKKKQAPPPPEATSQEKEEPKPKVTDGILVFQVRRRCCHRPLTWCRS